MGKHILLVQGHPDGAHPHLCHALARAYAEGAGEAGHTVDTVEPARLDFPLLTNPEEWQAGVLPPQLEQAQAAILRAHHLVFIYPLWLGDMPAILKGFLEQVARPGFAIDPDSRNPFRAGLLRGRSARLVISMGMPAPVYRWWYGAHGLKLMRRNILGFAGVAPVHATIVGGTGDMAPEQVEHWRDKMHSLGAAAS